MKKDIQRYQSPTREALEVVARGRNIQGFDQQKPADVSVYGNYLVVDDVNAGYSVAVLQAEDAQRLAHKPPMTADKFWPMTTLGELGATAGTLLYGMIDSASHRVGNVDGPLPLTEMLAVMGVAAASGVGAAAARTRRIRQYRSSITQACSVANQNFIPNSPTTFPDLSPETPIKYGQEGQEVAYGELWSAVSALQQELNNPKPEEALPERQLHAANLMRGMVSNFWANEGRKEFLCAAMEPWTGLRADLGRLKVYQGAVDASDSLKQMHEPQAVRTASHLAGLVAGFLNTRGMELHGSASQQYAEADTSHAMNADQDVVTLLTTPGVISRARADVVLSVDAAYRQG